jgi:hypothetical protein
MTNDDAGRIVGRWLKRDAIAKGRELPALEEWQVAQQNREAALSVLPEDKR